MGMTMPFVLSMLMARAMLMAVLRFAFRRVDGGNAAAGIDHG
jgi:hypothetical protein